MPYVVFERENFNPFSMTSQEYIAHSAHSCHKEITRKGTLEYKRDYDENSDINARTQVQDLLGFLSRSVETWSKTQEHNSRQTGGHVIHNGMIRLERSFDGVCVRCFRENVKFEDLCVAMPCHHMIGCKACCSKILKKLQKKRAVMIQCFQCKQPKSKRFAVCTKKIDHSEGIKAPSLLTHPHDSSSEFQFDSILLPRSGLYVGVRALCVRARSGRILIISLTSNGTSLSEVVEQLTTHSIS